MKICGDFTAWCFECDCINLILALILGISICFSVCRILNFFEWKIKQERKFDRAIFENFRRSTLQVGNTQNNGQNKCTTPTNENVQNPCGTNGN